MKSVALTGDLQFIGLPDILQLLGSITADGTLYLHGRFASGPAVIYFESGSPIHAVVGSASGLDALFSLFAWSEGTFDFRKEPVYRGRTIRKHFMEIILEGLRRLDDGQISSLQPLSTGRVDVVEIRGQQVSIPIIESLDVEFTDVVDEDVFHENQKIVTEGRHGNWIWVVLEGRVDIVKTTPRGDAPIVRIGPGGFIGSLSSFLFEGNVRSATAVAVEDVLLGVLNSQQLSREFSIMPSDLKQLLISLDRRLRQVTNKAVEIQLKPGVSDSLDTQLSMFWKQGKEMTDLFEITDGSVQIVYSDRKRHWILAELGKGDYFGFIPFANIGPESSTASVLADRNLKIRQIDTDALQQSFDRLSSTFKHLIQHVSNCIAITHRLACIGPSNAQPVKQS